MARCFGVLAAALGAAAESAAKAFRIGRLVGISPTSAEVVTL